MTAYSGLRLIASASGLLLRPMPRADSRDAAGASLPGNLSRGGQRGKTNPEGRYRNANQTRPIPKATTPAPASISTALCGPENNPVPCPNQKSPTATNNGPTTRRTIFMRAPLIARDHDSDIDRGSASRNRKAAGVAGHRSPLLVRMMRSPHGRQGRAVRKRNGGMVVGEGAPRGGA